MVQLGSQPKAAVRRLPFQPQPWVVRCNEPIAQRSLFLVIDVTQAVDAARGLSVQPEPKPEAQGKRLPCRRRCVAPVLQSRRGAKMKREGRPGEELVPHGPRVAAFMPARAAARMSRDSCAEAICLADGATYPGRCATDPPTPAAALSEFKMSLCFFKQLHRTHFFVVVCSAGLQQHQQVLRMPSKPLKLPSRTEEVFWSLRLCYS